MATLLQNLSLEALSQLTLEDLLNLRINEENSNSNIRFIIDSSSEFNRQSSVLMNVSFKNRAIGKGPSELNIRTTQIDSFDESGRPLSTTSSLITLQKESQGASYATSKSQRNV